ncbi:RcnB family protein [Novosphingobium sp. 9]|uniref:RcnB family protein n=1 Tax=Novosphingobium sp. 9 TaxID=2025349 RepID=UPI0021B516E7|nr:RcnB family protein [Novosphingobium sp. 9]
MKKILMAVAAASVALPALAAPTIASAQSRAEVRHDNREIRQDRRELRRDRQERREDWRDYRQAHRDVYHRPAYAGPRGYRYVRVGVGHRFAPAYYGQRYWVNDYARYRLPAPRAGARWIRYGNDVVLVNTRTGVVLQAYNGFFW